MHINKVIKKSSFKRQCLNSDVRDYAYAFKYTMRIDFLSFELRQDCDACCMPILVQVSDVYWLVYGYNILLGRQQTSIIK
jgi:hypothetical protein